MAKRHAPSTQNQVPIREIRDGVVLLKNGTSRTVLMVNAINFSLKSQDEQQALINNYQSFLNGISFPIQIVTQSRTLDLDDYLAELQKVAAQQGNDLLRTQTTEYVNFVNQLIGVANIMSKTFYVVIPYESDPLKKSGGFFSRLFGRGKGAAGAGKAFELLKNEIGERTAIVSNGLASLGLSNIQLNTQELIELYYSTYNMDTARRQKLFSISNVDVAVIQQAKSNQNGTI